MTQDELKIAAAKAALQHIEPGSIIGVGTGSTISHFIEALASIKHKVEAAVASSFATEKKLLDLKIPVYDLNTVYPLPLYVDGADEINSSLQMIKGGGGALTKEKIIATAAKKVICIADETKKVEILGKFPLPIEVIPIARSFVARELVKLGGKPIYREGFKTDNDNVILDVWGMKILEPKKLEQQLNQIPGIVTNGIFANSPADLLLLGTGNGVLTLK